MQALILISGAVRPLCPSLAKPATTTTTSNINTKQICIAYIYAATQIKPGCGVVWGDRA